MWILHESRMFGLPSPTETSGFVLFCFIFRMLSLLVGIGQGWGHQEEIENQEVISSVILFTYLPIFPCIYVCARVCLLPILLGALLF